ncbi:helix-turn-helix domain-containing protein [Anaerocolumna sedimenticola]|uniref:Helix-turn-helix domain-containing protein n=1 Tax=Anaerocolumna sedimenticola TaxID=2696063 RepID=A0A6P1TLE2_9FIRM|nr:AraC family transcriptional regulator [Anaerocolumna sedimenticola]QHQ61097.1 helix-turn-helix domain-containing protein [Anaerocolumna sedimenticola]
MLPLYLTEKDNNFSFEISIHDIKNDVYPHGHSFLELHYVFEGQGIEKINGIEHIMKPGTFAVIFPYQIHEMHIIKGSEVHLYNLCLSAKTLFDQDEYGLVMNKLLFDIDLNARTIYDMDEDTSEKVFTLLSEIHAEFKEDEIWRNFMLKAKIVELFILFDRYRRSLVAKENNSLRTTMGNDTWSIIHYVYKNWNTNITLKSLSQLFYLSEPYISTSFKQCLGISFHAFLRDLRIENACSLLTSSKMSITDITYEVGYLSYSTFVRVFHARKGVSPAMYRQIIKDNAVKT